MDEVALQIPRRSGVAGSLQCAVLGLVNVKLLY
jgi:hypothetical protein